MHTFCIVGFGKIGQAMVAHILSHGHAALAIDSNPALLQQFLNGEMATTEPGVADLLRPALKAGLSDVVGTLRE